MNNKTDPFTRTPGVAGKAYIDNGVADEIIRSFLDEASSKYVYKITGLRGSGKSVEYSRVIQAIKKEKNWLVYPLSAAGDAVSTLISKLSMEKIIDSKSATTALNSTTSFGGNAAIVSGTESISISRTVSDNEHYYSDEAALTKMIDTANKENYRVLIAVDDISKTPDMINLLSMIGSMILEGLRIYLIVTGLAENIEDFSSEKNLTFFKRADSIEIRSLNRFDIVYMYEKLLGVDSSEAKKMEEETGGYAYAYQVLGSLYFKKEKSETLEDIMPDFERILFKDSYDLIWKSLTDGEKEVVRCICRTATGRSGDIKALMKNPASYSVYRDRLINKHLVDGDTRGYLKIKLPRFEKFVDVWGSE